MSTMTRDRKTVKPFTCRFVSINVEINDTRYAVDPIEPGEDGTMAFRLAKHSGDHAVYDVIRTHAGVIACDCPDYEARHRGNGHGLCKHGRALVELGLMPAPLAPAAAPCCPADEPSPCKPCQASAPAPAAGTIAAAPPAAELPPDLVEVEADPADWPAWTDADTWELGAEPESEPEPEPAFDLAGLVDHFARSFDALPTDAGRLMGDELGALAFRIRLVSATTPAEYRARVETLEADARDQHYRDGFEDGRAGRSPVELLAFGHMA